AFAQVTPPTVGQPGKDVVWVPTPPETVEKMLDMAQVTARDVVMDLGSGDGRNIIAAARRGARAIGVEFNPDLVAFARQEAAKAGVSDRATFIEGDMYEADISEATVMALFLLPENLRRLTPKFLALRPGARIVANTFSIPEWDPDDRATIEGDCVSWCEVLLWIVPAKAHGTWTLPQGTLTLEQDFQKVTGRLVPAGGGEPVSVRGRLRGDQITFEAGGIQFSGRVEGNTLTGTVLTGGRSVTFTGSRGQ
ncbi:MAG: methyltransferase domain-containing protein, partial [Acidobacteriota bacterium]